MPHFLPIMIVSSVALFCGFWITPCLPFSWDVASPFVRLIYFVRLLRLPECEVIFVKHGINSRVVFGIIVGILSIAMIVIGCVGCAA